jgi:hypothetical protein
MKPHQCHEIAKLWYSLIIARSSCSIPLVAVLQIEMREKMQGLLSLNVIEAHIKAEASI